MKGVRLFGIERKRAFPQVSIAIPYDATRWNQKIARLRQETPVMDVRAVLFDFDFTLADPSPWLIPAWVEALRGDRRAATK